MEINGFTATIFAGLFSLTGAAIAHVTSLMTSQNASDTQLSVADEMRKKETALKEMEIKHEIDMSKLTANRENALAEKKFVQDIIQKTLDSGTVEEQINNLRSYATIGLIGDPYRKTILDLEPNQLPSRDLERIQGDGTHDLPISYFQDLVEQSKSVGAVQSTDGNSSFQNIGNAFLLPNNVIATNNHVIRSVEDATNSMFWIHSIQQRGREFKTMHKFELRPDILFVTDKLLDYTLVAVEGYSDRGMSIKKFSHMRSKNSIGAPQLGNRVTVVHLSLDSGWKKLVSMRETRVLSIVGDYIHFTSGNSTGSSGAPILDDKLNLVGLHHAQVPKTDEEGRWLMRDGEPFKPGDDPKEIDWIAKEGVLWSSIVRDLSQKIKEMNENEQSILKPILDE